MSIPVSAVHLDDDVERMVLEVLRSGQLAQGPMVARLEREFAELCGVAHAVAVSNGTVALVAALQALGVGPGDEVVTTPFTFVATLNAILECGATARFADVDAATFTLDPDSMLEAMTDRTRVVMPVHLYGQAADIERISRLAADRDIAVVEDAAQAHGASQWGRTVGSWGRIGCFSFYATKNVTSGEGGLLTTDDSSIADTLRMLRNEGMRDRYQYETAGHNYRLTDIQAAIAIPQLARLKDTNARRRENAAYLDAGLAGLNGLRTPVTAPGRMHVFHQYTVRVPDDASLGRDDLARRLSDAGVGSGVYYPRVVFDYPCYREHPNVVVTDVPEAERAAREVLSLPVHPWLSRSDLDRIVEAVRLALTVSHRDSRTV